VINESLMCQIFLFSRSFYLNSSSLTLTPTPHAGLVSSSGLIIRPTPAASDSYSDLALLSVKRILDSFRDIQNFGTKVPTNLLFIFHFYYQISSFDLIVSTKFILSQTSSAHVKFSVRMVMTMTLLDMAEAKGTVRVPLFSSLSPSSSASLIKNVSQEVNIPR
jgi:hypothetical protein